MPVTAEKGVWYWGRGSLGASTYHDDRATKDQIPQQVLFPVELWVCGFQLSQILEDKVCVHDYAQLGACQEEAGGKAPNLGRELEDLEVVEVEPLDGKEAEVATN